MRVSVISLLFLIFSSDCYDSNELKIIFSLAERFVIKQCILVSDDVLISPPQLKYFSNVNIFTVYFTIPRLVEYLNEGEFPDARTVIVLKVMNYSDSQDLFKKFNVIYKQTCSRFTWVTILNNENDYSFENNFYIPFNCEFFLTYKINETFFIKEIYQRKRKSNPITSNFGYYNNQTIFNFSEEYIYRRRNDFQGESIILEISDLGPCEFPIECFHYELWQDMAVALNFSEKIIKTQNLLINNSVIPDANNYVELLHAVTEKKEEMFGPVLLNKAHMYIKRQSKEKRLWNVYLQPFDKNLWFATLSWILATSAITLSIAWVASSILTLQGYDLLEHALVPLSAFCNQGSDQPEITSSRIAITAAFLASAIILPAYSAAITSFLTVDRTHIPFSDLETFVMDGTYKLAPFKNNFTLSYFKEAHDGIIKTIRDKYLLNYSEFPTTHERTVEMVCNHEKLSLINFNYRMTQLEAPCKVIRVSDTIMTIFSAIKLENEGVRYRKLFLDLLIRFRLTGVIGKTEKRLYGRIDSETTSEFEPILIDAIISLIGLISLGLVCSLLFLLAEILYYRSKPFHDDARAEKT